MSNISTNQETNDFWLDCLSQSKKPNNNSKSTDNIFLNPLIKYINCSKRNKKINKKEVKSLYKNSKVFRRKVNSAEKPKKTTKKFKHSLDYFNDLYNRGMELKLRKNKIIKNKDKDNLTIERKEKNLYEEKNKNKKIDEKILKKIKKNYENSTIYERGIKFQQKKMIKIAELFEQNNKLKNIIYPFHPYISFKNLNHVFFDDNFFKEQADNDSTKIFLSRLFKARKEEELKKNFFENNFNKDIFKGKKLKKSLSQVDSLLYRKKLHEALIDFKCLPTNESNNNDSVEDFFMN